MKVKELIGLLEVENPEAEVRMAFQPTYPIEYGVAGVASDIQTDSEEGDTDDGEEDVVYLAQGQWLGYSTRRIWRAVEGDRARAPLPPRVNDPTPRERELAALVCDEGAAEPSGLNFACWVAASLPCLGAADADRVGWIACDTADALARGEGRVGLEGVRGEARRRLWAEAARRLRTA